MHPYKRLPAVNFWRSAVTEQIWSDIKFKPSVRFRIGLNEKVATAGSCFAQHIAGNLSAIGLTHFISEKAPTILTEKRAAELQYGVFSARYGNIYTARQLRQLIESAFGLRAPISFPAKRADGWVDLLRPGVQAEGYESVHDLECDRAFHLDCVKRIFLEADCFVFTLGLTEAWFDLDSGIVFPVCPGTKAGVFDPKIHRFHNFNVIQVIQDLGWCIEFVKKHNPDMKWIFTVSPVALAATVTNQHVLIATTASKATLRAAADAIYNRYLNCEYFPSYEITVSPPSFGQFLDSDLRSISPRGVNLVLRVFREAFVVKTEVKPGLAADERESLDKRIQAAVKVECDESFNDPAHR